MKVQHSVRWNMITVFVYPRISIVVIHYYAGMNALVGVTEDVSLRGLVRLELLDTKPRFM